MTYSSVAQSGISPAEAHGLGEGKRPPLGGPFPPARNFRGEEQTNWFVVWTNPNCDERARVSIERAGFEARVLTWRKLVRHNRSKQAVFRKRRLLPRYVFVRLERIGDSGVVRCCDGVEGFLGVKGRPLAISSSEMGALIAIEAIEEFAPMDDTADRPVFAIGSKVKIGEGHRYFAGVSAQVVALHGKREVSLIFEKLSGARPVRIALDMLETTI